MLCVAGGLKGTSGKDVQIHQPPINIVRVKLTLF